MVVAYILDTRRATRKGLYPVKVRVSYNQKTDYLPTGYAFTKADFISVRSRQASAAQERITDELDALVLQVRSIIHNLPVYSVQAVRILLIKKFYQAFELGMSQLSSKGYKIIDPMVLSHVHGFFFLVL